MADKRYQLTFTETSWKLIGSLIKYGHNIRDVLNAGVVLYEQSDKPTRAMAEMRANANFDEEIKDLELRLDRAKREKIEYSVGAGRMNHIVEGEKDKKHKKEIS
jgi:hypothetical protein